MLLTTFQKQLTRSISFNLGKNKYDSEKLFGNKLKQIPIQSLQETYKALSVSSFV